MKQYGNFLVISTFLGFALFVAIVGPYLSLKGDELLVVHDENFTFSQFHPIFSPFTIFNGTLRIFISPINLLDKTVTWLLEEASVPLPWVQMSRHLISLSVLFVFPYFGFRKIAEAMDLPYLSHFEYALVASTFSLGLYSLITVNSGIATTLDCALAIGLFPYLIGSVWEIAKSRTSIGWVQAMKFALLLGVYCYSLIFVFPMFIAAVIIISFVFMQQPIKKHVFYSFGKIILLTAPLILYMVLAILVALSSPPDYAASIMDTAAGGNIKLGVLGKFLQYHTWTIYNLWPHRAIGGYEAQVASLFSNFLTLGAISIGIASFRFIGDSKIRQAMVISFIFLIFGVFFGKAYGPPFGETFNFLLVSLPMIFGLIRTPDTKMGLLIALAVSMLLLISISALSQKNSSKLYKRIIILMALCYIGFFGAPFFSGNVMMGGGNIYFKDRLSGSSSYIWTSTPNQQDVIDYVNGIKEPINILPFPPSMHVSTRAANGKYIGQDIFLSQLHHTVFSYPYPSVTEKDVFSQLDALFKEYDPTAFEKLNIRLVIARKYADQFDANEFNLFSRMVLTGRSTVVYEGPDISVYKINADAFTGAGSAFNSNKINYFSNPKNIYRLTLVIAIFVALATFILYFCLMLYSLHTSKTLSKC
ncbi:MAG: hypothetical protein Q7T65_04015 [Thiobacillus sp.]|nr:hypothetical protein [Thiobacillus sp.]